MSGDLKLAALSVDLPLIGFFVVAPSILIIFHFYVLLQLLALSKTATRYNALLQQEAPVASDREYLRQRLDSLVFLQLLSGRVEQQAGFSGFSLRFIAWVTLIGVPLLILLQAQVTFLPYHLAWVVWLQRVTILVDLALIQYFWPLPNPQRIRLVDTERQRGELV
jgi:hypothetical protein